MAVQQLRGRVVRLDGAAAPEPPRKIRLFKFGKVDTTKGEFLFDKKSAESVMKTWRDYGNDLCFDYEHKAVDPDARAGDGLAAGWFKLAIGTDGLYAVDIRWTDKAAKQITSREWRYFSPTFEYESESGRILELVNVALTNIPATKDLPPLVASKRKPMPTKTNKVTEVRTPKKAPKKSAKLGVKKTTKTSEVTEYNDDAESDELDDAADQGGDSSDEMSALDDGELDDADLDDGDLDDADLDDADLDDAELAGDPDDTDMPMKSKKTKKTSRNGSAAVRAVAAVERFSRENALLNRRLAALEARERNTRVRDLVEGAIESGKVLPAEREFLTAAGRSDIKSLRVYLSKRTSSGVKLGKRHEAPQLDAAIDATSVPEAGKMLAQLGNARTYEAAKKDGTLSNFDPRQPMKLERN